MTYTNKFKENLKELRLERNLGQVQLAKELGEDKCYILPLDLKSKDDLNEFCDALKDITPEIKFKIFEFIFFIIVFPTTVIFLISINYSKKLKAKIFD